MSCAGISTDGKWQDEEVIWSTDEAFYTSMPDIAAGGRIAFDPRGYLFLTVGIKGGYFEGIQDLATPYGKIHRVHDDGRIPDDNPFVNTAGRTAEHLDVRSSQPARSRVRCEDQRAVGIGDGSAWR